jgi:GalNAc-alpha-(1->4)-GalNAc-alpha-(1->3)-diNAcBac-PP-undecaprenol alpha-1,4-N-acetyl-D-galactosaminyltransferase
MVRQQVFGCGAVTQIIDDGMPEHYPADIALVIADLGSGGAQRVLTILANEWCRRGVKVVMVTLAEPETDFFSLAPGISRVVVGGGIGASNSIWRSLRANVTRLVTLRRTLRRTGAPTVLSFIGSMNVLTVIATRGLGIQVIISERNDPALQPLPFAWRMLRRLAYGLADRVTANSHGALSFLGKFVRSDKLAYVPNPLSNNGSEAVGSQRRPTILTVARFCWQKAHDVLLDAFARIADEAPDWRLQLAGTGELEADLRQRANDLGIGARIDWLGQVADLSPCYRSAAIFALPSRFEGTPNALLEAMNAGLPAIITDASSGPLEFVDDGLTGLIVTPDDAEALAGALRQLINKPELRQRLGEAAKARMSECAIDNVMNIWNELLSLPGQEADCSKGMR